MSDVTHNVEVINNKIIDASKGKKVTLVGVSKTVDVDRILEAKQAGIKIFGENRVQELVEKKEVIKDVDWHMIGKLQKNKVKFMDDDIKMIQSIDSIELCESINKHLKSPKNVLLQVNIGQESQKNGFFVKNLINSLDILSQFDRIKVKGIMCVPPFDDTPEKYFFMMKDLFEEIKDLNISNIEMEFLSMGMSGDFEQAIKCGSNMVRVGSSIFGKRL